MNFNFDTESDFGVDYGGVPSYDFGDFGGFDAERINDLSYGRYSPMSSGSSLDKIFEAINKANAFKAQSSGTATPRRNASGTTATKIGNSATLITQAPKITRKSGGGGLFGSLGGGIGTLGTALGVFGPAGAAIGGLVGKGIDAFSQKYYLSEIISFKINT